MVERKENGKKKGAVLSIADKNKWGKDLKKTARKIEFSGGLSWTSEKVGDKVELNFPIELTI